MMGWFGGGKEDTVGRINFEQQQPQMFFMRDNSPRVVEFEGALAEVNEDTGKLEFVPRGVIYINVNKIGGFYDHTLLLFGNKIRVMETAAQIYVKIKESET